jgi:hypothetical protein
MLSLYLLLPQTIKHVCAAMGFQLFQPIHHGSQLDDANLGAANILPTPHNVILVSKRLEPHSSIINYVFTVTKVVHKPMVQV